MFVLLMVVKSFWQSPLFILIFEIGSAFKRICSNKEQKTMCSTKIIDKNVDY